MLELFAVTVLGLEHECLNEIAERLPIDRSRARCGDGLVHFEVERLDAPTLEALGALRSVEHIAATCGEATLPSTDDDAGSASLACVRDLASAVDWDACLELHSTAAASGEAVPRSKRRPDGEPRAAEGAPLRCWAVGRRREPSAGVAGKRKRHAFNGPDACQAFALAAAAAADGRAVADARVCDACFYLSLVDERVRAGLIVRADLDGDARAGAFARATSGGLTALNPAMAALLCRLAFAAAPSGMPDLRLLDPCCGAGTIPIEAAQAAGGARLAAALGVDVDARCVADARANIAASGTGGVVAARCLDALALSASADAPPPFDLAVSDLPFGVKHASFRSNREFYGQLLAELHAGLAEGGAAVLLCVQKKLMLRLLGGAQRKWEILATHDVHVGKGSLNGTVLVLRRLST